jgi:CheY-like chemotaxis protein/HPt (histidine-containing phosphotransfer) domain-containing protein
VDDSEINREIIKQALEQDGVTVTLAGDGRQTLALLRQTPRAYDAVLMDVQMPDLDGLAATRSIRTELGLTDLPIIALTAGVLPAQRQQALAAGMNDVLTKPVRLEAMMAMIRRAVAAEGRAGPPAEAFPTIPGIDRELATEILCGNRALFLRLLGIFSAQSDGLVGRVRQELAQGDGKAAARRLHNLGGNAGSLGAMAIMALARQLEAAIAVGESDLDAALAELDRQLQALCLATAPWLAPGDAPGAT